MYLITIPRSFCVGWHLWPCSRKDVSYWSNYCAVFQRGRQNNKDKVPKWLVCYMFQTTMAPACAWGFHCNPVIRPPWCDPVFIQWTVFSNTVEETVSLCEQFVWVLWGKKPVDEPPLEVTTNISHACLYETTLPFQMGHDCYFSAAETDVKPI